MIIVGFTGEIGSGKTTMADYLAEQSAHAGHWESWQLIGEVATALRLAKPTYPDLADLEAINAWLKPLPRIVHQSTSRQLPIEAIQLSKEKVAAHPEHYHKLFEHLGQVCENPDLQTEEITESSKEIFRPLLQWLGGYLVTMIDEGIWYDEILRRIKQRTDVDLATIGGVRFPGEASRIQTAGGTVIRIVRPHHQTRDAHDLTERQNAAIPADSTIDNDGSLKQLERCSRQVLQDLRLQRLAPNYRATNF